MVKIAVIGLGYIGLPTAAILATHGADVVGIDIAQRTVNAVNQGKVPFVEPDLEAAVSNAVKAGRLRAQTTMAPADVFMIAVPTPLRDDHSPDLSYIDAAADAIAPVLQGGELVILESTVPPGTTQRLADHILKQRPDLDDKAASDSEAIHFALPGTSFTGQSDDRNSGE